MARPPSRSATATSAPKWRSMRSVWSRVASASITVVSPAACRPAISTAHLICAEATGSRYSIGTRSALPRIVRGSVSLPRSATSSPICFSGSSTRPMGRRESDASPTNRTRISWPAITPIISRMPVPELPKSISPAGSARPPTPRPRTSQIAPDLAHRAAQRLQRLGGIEDVLALKQAGYAGAAGGQRPEHQRAVRDRLVARHAHAARQRPRPACGQRRLGLVGHGRQLASIWLCPPACWGAMLRRHRAAGVVACQHRRQPGPPERVRGPCVLGGCDWVLTGSPARGKERPKFAVYRQLEAHCMSTKADRGTKRTCQNPECGSRFYDLNRNPITCPICGSVYELAVSPMAVAAAAPVPRRRRPHASR